MRFAPQWRLFFPERKRNDYTSSATIPSSTSLPLIQPDIIAPDSSHWAKWIDATVSVDLARRARALSLHTRLLERGRIPFLSWHHLEELLGGEDDTSARVRVGFLQELPLIAWFRLPTRESILGSVIDVLAAEAMAASEGCHDLIAIRDRARSLLLRTGTGVQAIGEEGWVWEAVRPYLHERKDHTDMVAALSPLQTFDEKRTIGELAKGRLSSPVEVRANFDRIYTDIFAQAKQATGGDSARGKAMADAFMARVIAEQPSAGMTVRELIVSKLVDQGLDADEVRDECVLADLTRLGVFRSQLRVVAESMGWPFETLKRVPMDILPSRVITDALRAHGQPRATRPGSDLNDGYLGVLAAYCATLYVDKRTAEDFQRAQRKEPRLAGLIGEIAKASDFESLLGPASC